MGFLNFIIIYQDFYIDLYCTLQGKLCAILESNHRYNKQTINDKMITGKDLLDLGYKPGNLFKEAIDYANSN